MTASAENSEVREHDRRIERLLADAEAAAGPVAWPRIEALITALVDLYGQGLERILVHARTVAGEGCAELDRRLQRDEVVASLLVLHDLHPMPVEARVKRALEQIRVELPDAAPLSLVGIEGDTATIRVEGDLAPSPHVVARMIEAEAPELTGVRVLRADVSASHARSPELVPTTRLVRGRGR